MNACFKLCLLLAREIEEAKRQMATSITDADEQVASPAVSDLRQQHFAGHQAARAGDECTNPDELRAVLVPERQQEQQVLDDVQAKLLELFRERRTDAFEAG